MYLAEIARKEKRGSLIIIQQLAIEVGILVMYFLGKMGGPTDSFSDRNTDLGRLWLYVHSRPSFFPYSLEYAVCALFLSHARSTFPP